MNSTRICPQCGEPFQPSTHRAVFCTPKHQAAFHNISAIRGKTLLPFAQVWRRGKRGRTEQTAYALAEMSRLLDLWAADDAKSGRRPDLIVASKHRDGWTAADLL